ncbi:MAG: phosphotransferase [Firmicutes bacterium]|nr:phosphotransferase [Bacillota bacterium]
MSDLLPRVTSISDYRRVYGDSQIWSPAIHEVAARHGLPGTGVRQTLGSHIVYRFGDVIVKLYFPMWFEDYRVERIALLAISGLPAPMIYADGEIEGWPYLVMSHVPGVPAVEVWRTLSGEDRISIAHQIGETMRLLHQTSLPDGLPADWHSFIKERIDRAESHHDAPEPWRNWIRQQLAEFREPEMEHVFLNCDLTEDHILLSESGGRWTISGIIDFGDARIGHPYYDFIAPLAHYAYGEPEVSKALLRGYGLEVTGPVMESLTKYCLLHEFGRLRDFLDRYFVADPEAFVEALWGAGRP